jgi:hypothetical protein
MDYRALKAEMDADPLGRGYAGMTDAQASASLNVANRTRVRNAMSASEVFQAISAAEFAAKTDAQRQLVLGILGFGTVNPAGREAEVFVQVFGAGSQTIAALAAARQETVSRATEIGLEAVLPGDIAKTRALT